MSERQQQLIDIYNNFDRFVETNNSQICQIRDTLLHISGFSAVTRYCKLKEYKIDTIINVSEEDHTEDIKFLWENNTLDYFWIPIEHDDPMQPIIEQCKQVQSIINSNPNKNIVIHCQAGISRSVAVVIFYLMSLDNTKTYEQCLTMIQETRYMADPNEGFEQQLNTYFKQV